MWTDFRHACRAFSRAPGFAAVAVLTLAVAIGANTAMFSVIHAVLLAPLPYRDAGRIVRISEGRPTFQLNVSYPNFLDWRARAHAFEDLAIYNPYSRAIVAGDSRAEAVPAGTTEARVFTLLGVQPIRGRLFTADEKRAGGPPIVIISDGLWRRAFGGSESAVGRAVAINGAMMTIVGVLPPEFRLQTIDVWYPLWMGISPMQLERGNHPGFQVYGRLAAGVDVDRAQREM